jgi:hypothetical protein
MNLVIPGLIPEFSKPEATLRLTMACFECPLNVTGYRIQPI